MTNPMENELIRLRALEPDDVQVLYKWENDTEVWKVSNTIVPFSKYMLLQFIANQQRDIFETRQLRLIIESKQSGNIQLSPIHKDCGILIYDKRDQGQGYASQALSSLIRYGFQVLGLNQLYCDIPSHNIRSLALFKSKGFTVVGLKKEWTRTTSDWQDEYMLQLLNPQKWG